MRARTRFGAGVSVALVSGTLAVTGCGGGKGGTSTATSTSHASYGVLVDAGTYLLHHGNLPAAEQLFAQAIARNPNDPVAHYDLGVAYQQAGDRHDALHEYRLALRADPNYTPALFNQATLLATVNPPLAIFYYRKILALKPDSPTALLNLGLLGASTHWPRHVVLAILRRAVRLDPGLRTSIPRPYRAALAGK